MSMTVMQSGATQFDPHVARRVGLRAHALFLMVASVGGLGMDIAGIFFARGPAAPVVGAAPHAGIGFVEAHGLALVIGVLLWRAPVLRSWHLVGAAVGVLLGTCNLVFWQFFIAADSLGMGYLTTSFHCLFAFLQFAGAVVASRDSRGTNSFARSAAGRLFQGGGVVG